jgi:hypothetical protein
MRRCSIAGILLVGGLVMGCGKEEAQPVADLQRTSTAPPPVPTASTKLKYQPVIGAHDAQKRYEADKPFTGNKAVAPENAPPVKNYVGTVRNVAGNSITVTVNGQDMTFPVGADIMVSDGRNPRNFPIQGGLASVRTGSHVRLQTRTTGGSEVVTFILVNSAEGN